MRKLMTNELASQYGFLGTRNDKRPFKNLKMKDLVLRKYLFMHLLEYKEIFNWHKNSENIYSL